MGRRGGDGVKCCTVDENGSCSWFIGDGGVDIVGRGVEERGESVHVHT